MNMRTVAAFSVSAYAPTNYTSETAKDSFYDALRALLQRAESSDVVVVAGDMNAQVGRLSTDEAQLGGCLGSDSVRTGEIEPTGTIVPASTALRVIEHKWRSRLQLSVRHESNSKQPIEPRHLGTHVTGTRTMAELVASRNNASDAPLKVFFTVPELHFVGA